MSAVCSSRTWCGTLVSVIHSEMEQKQKVLQRILQHFPHEATSGQKEAVGAIADFVTDHDPHSMFLLKGYAGTGKTSLVSAVVSTLKDYRIRSVLLAPTGRAAKVLGGYTGRRAHTIHKAIYMQRVRADGSISLELATNSMKRTLFIVDEASMITDETEGSGGFSGRKVLSDLFQFVFSGERCRLMLIGDVAQLPPVGLDISPALDTRLLKAAFSVKLYESELTDVVRQARDSGILSLATCLREKLAAEDYSLPLLRLSGQKDVVMLPSMELEDSLNTHISQDRPDQCVVVTRSNRRANMFNQQIRHRILYRESEIDAGDLLMIVRNNYFWLEPESPAGFIANGDLVELQRIDSYEEKHGLRFARMEFSMLDYPGQPAVSALAMLDTLASNGPSLGEEDQEKLFAGVMEEHAHTMNRQARLEAVRNDPYYNALQIKFAHALTCHKTQGGQWPAVFIDQGYLNADMIGRDYLRWLYTALTRATDKVFLLGFREEIVQ